jgi:hypothetical protein
MTWKFERIWGRKGGGFTSAVVCGLLVVPLWSSAHSTDVECNLATYKLGALERAEQLSRSQGDGWWCGTPMLRAKEYKKWVCSQKADAPFLVSRRHAIRF